jgi:hypothetical protein
VSILTRELVLRKASRAMIQDRRDSLNRGYFLCLGNVDNLDTLTISVLGES